MPRDSEDRSFRYPLKWRIMDGLNAALDLLWPRRLGRYTGWALLTPALLLVGILVLGLFQIAENSLHTLDTSTFLPGEEYTLANYRIIAESPTYWRIVWRSLLGAGLTVFFTLLLALPYSYIMARTNKAALRKTLLIVLFLPFFIGQ